MIEAVPDDAASRRGKKTRAGSQGGVTQQQHTSSRKRVLLTTLAAVILVLGAGAVAAGVWASRAGVWGGRTDGIARGVIIAGLPVGDQTRDEATQHVRRWARRALARPVTFSAPVSGRRWNLTLGEVGGRFDVAGAVDEAYQVGRKGGWLQKALTRLRAAQAGVEIRPVFQISETALKKRLTRIGETIRVRPRNARARMDEYGILEVTHHERKGVRLDVAATAAGLLKQGKNTIRNGTKVPLVVAEEAPSVTTDALGAVSHQLGAFSTYYGSSSSNRRHNVELAARHIDGTLLGPGEVFSYNEVVGPRWPRLGWRNAPTYQDGQVVPGPGGGVCQVSTTLYNAALLANLKIVQRSNHSMPVHYVPAGRDATVSYGSLDFRFANNTGAPVYVAARARGSRLTMALYGKKPTNWSDVRVVSGGRWYTRIGGYGVSTWRVVTGADGSERRESLGSSSYRPLVKKTVAAPSPRPARRRTRTARRPRRSNSPPTTVVPAAAPAAPESSGTSSSPA